MDRNLIIAIVLTTIVVLFFSSPVYQKFFGDGSKPATVQTPQQTVTTPESPSPNATDSAVVTPERADSTGLNAPSAADTSRTAVPAGAAVQDSFPPSKEVVLENEDIRLVIDTRGGVITQAVMKNHTGEQRESHAQLVSPGQTWYGGAIIDNGQSIPFSNIVFSTDSPDGASIVLNAGLTNGRNIRREYHLGKTGYMIRTTTAFQGGWNDPRVKFAFHGSINKTEPKYRQIRIWPFSMFMPDDSKMYDELVFLGEGDRVTQNNGKEKSKSIFVKSGGQKIQPKKEGRISELFAGDLTWYAVKNKYFMLAAIPEEQKNWKARSESEQIVSGKWYDFEMEKKVGDGDLNLSLYIGPNSYTELKEYGHNLTQAVDLSYKFLRPLAILFLWLIRQIHLLIPNWGLVLIVFSIIIKTVLWPLTKSSTDSMKKVSQLQPKINALKEKYKGDPQKLQAETMELYKREKVNPFGGCLPMILQMPVFFALFPVVGKAFELRQAMFIPHWIEDLSRPDPFFILPVAMGISFYLQSRTTMTDPNQKSMLYIMPVMMVLMFANFSSGLTLYWLMFNLLSWGQQTLSRA